MTLIISYAAQDVETICLAVAIFLIKMGVLIIIL
jgi:hypothetical protein